jgi:competence protein ComEA helix-hairpin-helix repeat region
MEISIFGKEFYINKILAICTIAILITGAGILGFFLSQVYHPLQTPVVVENTSMEQTKSEEPSNGPIGEVEVPDIKVYVTGCVNNPGIFTIKKGQVIDDAIKAAGGATKDADLENINLAYQLNENTMLRIRARGTLKASSNTQGIPKQNSGNANQGSKAAQTSKTPSEKPMNSGVDIVNDSLGAVVQDEESKAAESSKSKLVNINKASQAELEELPNVGPSTAKAIIDYREKNGGFKKVTDIMKITGIKQKTFDKIKDYICVE